MDLFAKSLDCAGSVLFRGAMPPRLDELSQFAAAGASVKPQALGTPQKAHWSAALNHPKWGAATVVCLRGAPMPPPTVIDYDAGLTAAEKALAKEAQSSITVHIHGERAHVLSDRKRSLGFLRLVMGADGLVAVDHTAERFWSRDALDDEFRSDADVDVEALFAIHVVGSPEARRADWAHTHGLAAIGGVDFDILRPAEDLLTIGVDVFRSVAFGIIEGRLKLGANRWRLGHGLEIAFVDVAEFNRRAAREDAALRVGADADHTTQRGVLCDPRGGGWLPWWRSVAAPAQALSRPIDDGLAVDFSPAATELMAARARGTLALLGDLREEFREFEFPALVKIGYPTDAGGDDREHLWFSVNAIGAETLDATLENDPINISSLKRGQRGQHPIAQLTDWVIITPAGHVTPRSLRAVRALRANLERLHAHMQAERATG